MSKALGMRCVWGLCGVLASVFALASVARAEVSTDVSGSVLGVAQSHLDGNARAAPRADRDTVIQISNTSNNLVHVGASTWTLRHRTSSGANPVVAGHRFQDLAHPPAADALGGEPGPRGQPDRRLRRRRLRSRSGAIPPVPPGFEGELKCVQVDASGTPFGGNNLKGEALSVGRRRRQQVQRDRDPRQPRSGRWRSRQRAAPRQLGGQRRRVQLLPQHDPAQPLRRRRRRTGGRGAQSALVRNDECPIRTYLTLVPCTQDFENAHSGVGDGAVRDRQRARAGVLRQHHGQCWKTTRLADIMRRPASARERRQPADRRPVHRGRRGLLRQSRASSPSATSGPVRRSSRITPVDLDGGVLRYAEEVHSTTLRPTRGPDHQPRLGGVEPAGDRQRYDATDPTRWASGRTGGRHDHASGRLLIGSASEPWCSRPAVRKGD